MTCYVLHDESGEKVGMMCGDLGPRCFHCGGVADALCDFPLGDEERTCDRPLCLRCAPEVGTDQNFCRDHNEQGPGLLLFRRARRRDEIVADLFGGKAPDPEDEEPPAPPRPKTPPKEKRWRAVKEAFIDSAFGWRVVAATEWTDPLDARATAALLQKKLKAFERARVQTWMAFLRDYRERWPDAVREQRMKTPPPDKRWRVWQSADHPSGACVLTSWLDQVSAELHAQKVGGTIETWDEYLAEFNRRWPRKKR